MSHPNTALGGAARLEFLRLYLAGATQEDLRKRFRICVARVRLTLATASIPVIRRRGHVRGPGGPTWKGGRRLQGGYVMIRRQPNDPLDGLPPGSSTSYVLEHRLVMARHIGRALRPNETVHHINGIKTDNRIENLQLRSGGHSVGVVRRCAACGSHDIQELPI